jgi:hypothetical protein
VAWGPRRGILGHMGPAERISADMVDLSQIPGRFAGSEGERAMLHAVLKRLPGGAVGRVEGFVAHVSPALVDFLHDAALLVAGLVGFWKPWLGALLGGVLTLSLLLEGSGRMGLFRFFMPKTPSYNFVVRRKVEDGPPLGTLVIATPLDAPSAQPIDLPWIAGRRPMRAVFWAALVITAMLTLRAAAEPWGPRTLQIYVVALLVLSTGLAIGLLAHHRPGVGKDDGSGAAVLLELVRRLRDRPLPGVDVWFAFTGCGRAYQGGMEAFLDLHGKTLTDPVLVVAVDDPARMPLRAVVSEGPLFPQHHRPTGPALMERLRWAGVYVPPKDYGGSTDARAALVRGYRALALKGGDGAPSAEAAARAADVLETVGRWFADDLARVATNRPALEELARATFIDEEVTPPPQPVPEAVQPAASEGTG